MSECLASVVCRSGACVEGMFGGPMAGRAARMARARRAGVKQSKQLAHRHPDRVLSRRVVAREREGAPCRAVRYGSSSARGWWDPDACGTTPRAHCTHPEATTRAPAQLRREDGMASEASEQSPFTSLPQELLVLVLRGKLENTLFTKFMGGTTVAAEDIQIIVNNCRSEGG